ncbi:MAG: ABC transporter permease [Microthrixaceae bacterium]|nr:ABC transporter permease [Microthrixaceae bacterium]
MDQFLQLTITGIPLAAVYAISATGLVVTYTISGIFNFAHGAIGMLAAFAYWQIHVGWGLPALPSLILVIFVIAPLFGALVERVLIRGLEGASEVVNVVVTTSLMIGLLGLANLVWPPGVNRNVVQFFSDVKGVNILGVTVAIHRLIMVAVAVLVVGLLWLLLNRTRIGVTMRAVVDDRSLLQLNGGRPARVSMFSWALGSSLAALAGILIAPTLNLQPITLTLMVVTAYAAAAVGRLRSLPLTFLGALILGLGESYLKGYIDTSDKLGSFQLDKLGSAFSPIVLLIAIIFLPQARLRSVGQQRQREHWKVPSVESAVLGAVSLVVVVVAVALLLAPTYQLLLVDALFFALVALSLVPLTGYAGQISLAQVTFAGVGGIVASMVGAQLQPLGVVVAVAVTGLFGGLAALPALRLQGIYLALATAALAMLMYELVFLQDSVMPANNRQVPPVGVGDMKVSSTLGQIVLLAVAFGLCSIGLVFLRRGRWGRRLAAMKDSPVACATLGLSLTSTKVATFAVSAGIAGLAGAVSGKTLTTDQLRFEANFPVTTFAVVGGVGVVSGALIGGSMLGVLPVMNKVFATNAVGLFKFFEIPVSKLNAVLPGLMGVSLGRNPTGLSPMLSQRFEPVRRSPVAAIGFPVAVAVAWFLAYRDVIDGWTFLALLALVLAVLPAMAVVLAGELGLQRSLVIGGIVVAGLAGAFALPWATLSDTSNAVRFCAFVGYGVLVGVAAGGVAGLLQAPEDERPPSPDMLGITSPLNRSDALEAERGLGFSEEELLVR